MPLPCSVCIHPQRAEIDHALVVDGAANRAMARQYGLSKDAVARHRDHIPAHLAAAVQAENTTRALDLLGELRALHAKAVALLLAAERAGDLRTALAGVREARATLEVLGEIEGQLDRSPTVNVMLSPEWVHLRVLLVEGLRPFPEAAAAIAAQLAGLEQAL